MSNTIQYKITCEEFPEEIEEGSITLFDSHETVQIAQELSVCYMGDYIYDWEDGTEPSDLFDIFVHDFGDNVFEVEFLDNVSHAQNHLIVVEIL